MRILRAMVGLLLVIIRLPCRALCWCGRQWRWALAAVVLLVVLDAAATLVTGRMVAGEIHRIKQRGEPVSLKDLQRAPVPDKDNAAVLYLAAVRGLPSHKEIDLIREGARLPEPGQPPPPQAAAEQILARCEPVFRIVEQAAARPAFRLPADVADKPSAIFRMRKLGWVLDAKAVLEGRRGRSHDAFNELALMLKLGDQIGSESVAGAYPVGRSLIYWAAGQLLTVMSLAPPTEQDCVRMHSLLGDIELAPTAVRATQNARCRMIAFFDDLRASPAHWRIRVVRYSDGQRYSFLEWSPQKLPWLARSARRLAVTAWAPFLNLDELVSLRLGNQAVRMAGQPYRDLASVFARSDRRPDISTSLPWYALGTRTAGGVDAKRTVVFRDLGTTFIGLGQWALALRVYHIRHGSYPDSLRQAREAVGWQLPKDPFSGKDFVYRREGKGYVLYSVGLDMKDNGGMDYRVWEQTPAEKRPPLPGYGAQPDIVIRMPS